MALTTIPVELVTLDDGVTISVTDNSDVLTLKSTDADENSGPRLALTRDSGSPADNDYIGLISFNADDDGGNVTRFGYMVGQIADASNSSEDGVLQIHSMVGGTERNRINITSTETVLNEDSVDLDFRVESNGNANMLFVDGGNDSVLVGHNTDISIAGESHELQVYDTNFSTISAATFRNGSDGANLTLAHSRSGTIGTQTILNDGDTMGGINFMGSDGTDMASYGGRIYCEVDGTPGSNDMPGRLMFATTADGATGSTERMRIQQDGVVRIGAVAEQTMGVLNARRNGAAIEFGHSNNSAGYFGTVGAFGSAGHPYIGFCTASEDSANTFSTFGHAGYIIRSNLSGDLDFMSVATASATGQTPTNRFKIAANGDLTGTDTSIGSLSDLRLKENIENFTGGLDLISKLTPRTFTWKDETVGRKEGTRRGFIAQEVLEVDNYWITEEDASDKEDLEYDLTKDTEKRYISKLTDKDALYVSALQEAITKIETLEAKVKALEEA